MTMARVETSPKGNQRDRILDILRDRSNARGYVSDVDVQLLARLTGIDDHDVAKQLWGLQKAGLIGFSVKKGHGQQWPFRFRLRKRLLNDTQPDQETAALGDHMARSITAPTRRAHPMGPDALDPTTAARRQKAEAGPVTTSRHTVSEPTERPSEAREPVAGTETPKATETPKEAVPVRLRKPHRPYTLPGPVEPDLSWREDYPVIAGVFARKDRMAKADIAVKALLAAGMDDLAKQARLSLPELSPLEREIIRFVEDLGG